MLAQALATGLLVGLPAGAPLIVMVSGGRDSVCLLDLAVRALGPAGVHALHVHHGLRAESDQEAEAVAELAAQLGVALTMRRADRAPATGNIQAWARDQRAALARELAAQLGCERIATAHTRTDLVETALFRLATQPGRRALLAMRPADGPWVRPLLDLTREQTGDYCLERGLAWADDPSNADPHYARARLRHEVVPVLRDLNPHAEAAIARTLAELREEQDALDALVDAALAPGPGPGATNADDAIHAAPPRAALAPGPSISRDELAALPAALGRLVLRALCERTTGAPCARAGARLAAVLELTDRGALDVGDGARVVLRGGVVRCERSQGPAAPTSGHPRP